ncbi:MAG: helix-turn-helix transcriptional regulator [Bacteroidota bacterium]
MTYVPSNLRYLRKVSNLSQQAFAEKVGLNRGNIASYEKGSAEPSLTNLLKIARFFGVDLLDFIDRDLAKELSFGQQVTTSPPPEEPAAAPPVNPPDTPVMISLPPLEGELSDLVTLAGDMETIIQGQKQYYRLKLAKLQGLSFNGQLLRLDYARLLDIAEDLLQLNKKIISASQPKLEG